MNKLPRKVLIAGAVVFSLVILLVLVITFLMPTDKIRQGVEEELTKATGGEVSIANAGIKWWPHLGVTLNDCKIEGTGPDLAKATGSPNELGVYSITLDQFVLQVAVSPLFQKEVLVDAIQLEGLNLFADFKGESYTVKDADLAVTDLKISMDAAKKAGEKPSGSTKRPVGEMIPEDLVLAFEGQASQVTALKLPLADVKFFGELDARVLTVESIGASLGGGTLEGSLEIDYERDPNGFLDFEAEVERVPATTLLQPWAGALAEKLETDLGGTIRGNCLLGNPDVISRTLTLTGELGSGPGVLQARQWLAGIGPYLGNRQDLMDIKFNTLSHSLRLERGRYLVDNLEIDGADTHWRGVGSLGLDGTIDLDVKVKLPVGFTPDLGRWSFMAETLRDADGRINLDLSLSGMAAKPQVGVNLGSLQDAAGSDAGEAVKKGLGGLLDKWKNR